MSTEAINVPMTEPGADSFGAGQAVPHSPPVTDQAAAHPGTSLPATNPFAGLKDSREIEFDPAKHALDENGQPRRDTLQRWINKNAGRKGAKPATVGTNGGAPSFADVESVLRDARAATAGETEPENLAAKLAAVGSTPTAESIIGILQTGLMLVGEEEGLLTPLEKEMLRRPLVRVLKKYEVGADVMPAEVDLIFAVLAVVASRLQKPKTATKWLKVKAWFLDRFFSAKGRALAANLRHEAPGVSS